MARIILPFMTEGAETKRAVFAEIANQLRAHPKEARLAASLAKHFKDTTAVSLQRASHLAYRLYVLEQPGLSLQVCQLLNDNTFKNNYNLWTWVELTLALEWKLRAQLGQEPRAHACAAAIRATYELGDGGAQAQRLRTLGFVLAGGLLYDDQIAEAERVKDTQAATSYRMAQLGRLLFMQALGGSTAIPVAELEQQLVLQLHKLRSV